MKFQCFTGGFYFPHTYTYIHICILKFGFETKNKEGAAARQWYTTLHCTSRRKINISISSLKNSQGKYKIATTIVVVVAAVVVVSCFLVEMFCIWQHCTGNVRRC